MVENEILFKIETLTKGASYYVVASGFGDAYKKCMDKHSNEILVGNNKIISITRMNSSRSSLIL